MLSGDSDDCPSSLTDVESSVDMEHGSKGKFQSLARSVASKIAVLSIQLENQHSFSVAGSCMDLHDCIPSSVEQVPFGDVGAR